MLAVDRVAQPPSAVNLKPLTIVDRRRPRLRSLGNPKIAPVSKAVMKQ
jgi:hypothetical protein